VRKRSLGATKRFLGEAIGAKRRKRWGSVEVELEGLPHFFGRIWR